jgi:predicted TIM-barrel fold metal-dependent hydrolase
MHRRTFLAGAAVAAIASLARAADEKKGWIDAHSHIWPATDDKFPLAEGQTVKDLKPPSFTDDELMALARPEGVERAVLIQHSIYHRFDNRCILDAVERHPERFRAVGMVDDHGPKPGQAMKELLGQGVAGFRITPFIRKEKPEAWLDTPGMQAMWKMAAETRQPMCCLINASDIPGVEAMCEKHPDTPVVIDHFARIGADGEIRDKDLAALVQLGQRKQVSIKISAFYALGKKQPPHDELIPMIKRLYEAVGPERLMWASDCPYQVQGDNNYKASISLVRDRLDFISNDDRQWLLRKTAEKVFFFA